jgi:iron-sulfur cluster assembly protein
VEGGCSGLNYDVKVVDRPGAGDSVRPSNGIRVFVDAFSAPHVNGMRVDWISTFQESRFVFENPNATGGCGCGVSFTTT